MTDPITAATTGAVTAGVGAGAATGATGVGILGWLLKKFVSKKLDQIEDHEGRIGKLEGLGQKLEAKIDSNTEITKQGLEGINKRMDDIIKFMPKRSEDIQK